MRPTANDAVHMHWPAERFYWGVLDASLLDRAHRRNPRRLGYLFEPLLPVTIDEVHAVYVSLDDGQVLACAAPREALKRDLTPSALSLSPDALPEHLLESNVDPARLNLLIGRFTTQPIRLERRRLLQRGCAALVLLALLLAIGLHRRAAMFESATNEVTLRTDAIYTDVLGRNLHASSQPPALQLTAELRRLRQTRRTAQLPHTDSFDPAIELEQLFRRWPNDAHLVTEAITLSPDALIIRASLPAAETAQSLAAIQVWNDWTRVQPEITNRRGESHLTLRFTRDAAVRREVSR